MVNKLLCEEFRYLGVDLERRIVENGNSDMLVKKLQIHNDEFNSGSNDFLSFEERYKKNNNYMLTRHLEVDGDFIIDDSNVGLGNILYVDDEFVITKMCGAMLNRFGYKVITQNSSVDALELFRKNPNSFDVVISDLNMPIMDGKSFTKEVNSIRSDIGVILCTGFDEGITEHDIMECGIDAIMLKPVLKYDMGKMVYDVLEKYR